MLQHGGLCWYGSVIAGIISGIIYLRKKKVAIFKTVDLIAPYVALAQAIGRIGCLLNGCCYGRVSQWGLYFKIHNSVLIPAQLYSSMALILIFIFLRTLQTKPHKEGQVFFCYLLLYSIKRFFLEFFRADNQIILFNLTLFQIISLAMLAIAAIGLVFIKNKKA